MNPHDIRPGMRVRVTTKARTYEATVIGRPYGSGPWVPILKQLQRRDVLLTCLSRLEPEAAC